MKPLKILFIVSEDCKVGTYFRYHNLAIALTQRGHDVTVYSQSSQSQFFITRETRDGVNYILAASIRGNRWIDFGMNPINMLGRLLQTYPEADVYHLFQPFPNAALPWLLRRKTKRAFFAYDWDDLLMNQGSGLLQPKSLKQRWAAMWMGWMEKHLPSQCDLLTTISHYLADLGAKRGAKNCQVLYNGIWSYQPDNKIDARMQLHLQLDAIYVGFMGWTPGEIDWCFQALQKSAATFPQLRLVFSGFNPRESLKRFPQLSSRVDYLGDLSLEKRRILNSALDLALLPLADNDFNRSRLPIKFTDYLAGGTPVLCSDIGEVGRLASQISGAIACEPNVDAWVNKFDEIICQLVHEPNKFGVDCQYLYEKHTWRKQAESLEKAYFDFLNRRVTTDKAFNKTKILANNY